MQTKLYDSIEQRFNLSDISSEDENGFAFMAHVLVQATLPHRDPGDVVAWGRSNGNFSLSIQPGVKKVNGEWKNIGVPYGTIPRLLMAWITTEASRTKERKLILGNSLSGFMRELGLVPTGGKWGSITRLKEQMQRLLTSRIIYQYDSSDVHAGKENPIAKERFLCWDENNPEGENSTESYILLDQDFFNQIIKNPVPVDMVALKTLKQSPLALDLYMWLTYRMSYLDKKTSISWKSLQEQFGSGYKNTHDFTKKVKGTLKKIQFVYPELKFEEVKGRLILYPSPTHVKKRLMEK